MNRSNPKRLASIAVMAGLALLLGLLCRPLFHLIGSASRDNFEPEALTAGHVDDASRLNLTKVAEVWHVPADDADAEGQLAELLTRAAAEGLHVSIAGKRHTMGGHTIYPGGIAVDMLPWNHLELDKARSILNVGAGATWRDIIPYLDRRGLSVGVMQSDNSFSVGGSISANCHGWQYDKPPIASTVESFRLMKTDGTIVRCSRDENPELFSLVLGGYGLFGIILDVDLRVVPNQRYRLEQYAIPIDQLMKTIDSAVHARPEVEMVYARLNIVPSQFFQTAIINAFSREQGEIPPLSAPGSAELRRNVFRGSAESDYGKKLRWSAETTLQPKLAGKTFSRNQLLNEGVEIFQNLSPQTTDILHEYFVPRQEAEGFVVAMRDIIQKHSANLLNVTVRFVNEDDDTFLRYADQDMVAFVMLFVQERSEVGERRMRSLTQELIDAAINHDGRYYLPYRLHATQEQFQQAYPQYQEFFERKRAYDPGELFQNQFYEKYGKVSEAVQSAR